MEKNTWNRERVNKFDAILARGLCSGLGSPDGQMCVEAAICAALGLPHGDDPQCVIPALRKFKIRLNDSGRWFSPQSRAAGLRDLGIAQLGSLGVLKDEEFLRLLQERTIRILIPTLFRSVFILDTPEHRKCVGAANLCEIKGTAYAANAAADAADAAANASYAADAASYASYAAADAADAAVNATYAADAAANASYAGEKYLLLSAKIALDILIELKSPGCEWL